MRFLRESVVRSLGSRWRAPCPGGNFRAAAQSAGTRLSWQRGQKPQPQQDELCLPREMRQAFWRRGVYSRTATPSARVTPVVTAGPTPHTGKMTAPPSGDCGSTFCALEFAPGRSHPGRDVTPDVAMGSQTPAPGRLRSFGSTADRGCVGGNSNGCHAQCERDDVWQGQRPRADAPYEPVLQPPRECASGLLPRRQLQGRHQN